MLKYCLMDINALIDKVLSYNADADEAFLKMAYNIATKSHAGQTRASGDPYITHVLATAGILADLHLDTTTIASGLLHDVVEDCRSVTPVVLEHYMGEDVAHIVSGVTKVNKLGYASTFDYQAENYRKMFLAMSQDIRVVLIKLADRTHNMRTLDFFSNKEKQVRIAQETLYIYAPLAHRMGIWSLKKELEDLSLSYIHPEIYARIKDHIRDHLPQAQESIAAISDVLSQNLNEHNIEHQISARVKHIYSIYNKIYNRNKKLEDIYDFIAARVVTNDIESCYSVLGIVHNIYKPINNRIKDYIAMPKNNQYQSIHTTVIAEGAPVEIQIRTQKMQQIAEDGVAAHWTYKEGASEQPKTVDLVSAWLRQMVDDLTRVNDTREYLEGVKINLFENDVYVFTPAGEVKHLPLGSTPVDFAYLIHTEIGHRCVGAKVNNKIVTIRYKLKNGDVVKIITSSKHNPGPDLLDFVVTTKARTRIRAFLRQGTDQELLAAGEHDLEVALAAAGIKIKGLVTAPEILAVANKLGCQRSEDLLRKVGDRKITVDKIIQKLRPEKRTKRALFSKLPEMLLGKRLGKVPVPAIADHNDMLYIFAKCCNPVRGDQIRGYITKGRGISVHRTDCSNIAHLELRGQTTELSWDSGLEKNLFNAGIKLEAYNREYLLRDLLHCISKTKVIITAAAAHEVADNMATGEFIVQIKNLNQLNRLIDKIKKVKGVIRVYRNDSLIV